MQETQEEALEAAKLAALVGAQLGKIDQMSDVNSLQRANKINVQKFIAKAKNPNLQIEPERYLVDIPHGFALPPDESLVQNSIPDVYCANRPSQPEYIPAPQPAQNVNLFTQNPAPNTVGSVNFNTQNKSNLISPIKSESVITRSDIDSVRNSLKSIDKTLVGLLDLMKNSKPVK